MGPVNSEPVFRARTQRDVGPHQRQLLNLTRVLNSEFYQLCREDFGDLGLVGGSVGSVGDFRASLGC